jgi:hypothetical protein
VIGDFGALFVQLKGREFLRHPNHRMMQASAVFTRLDLFLKDPEK